MPTICLDKGLFHLELESCDLLNMIHWTSESCVFKYRKSSLFWAQLSGGSYHNGLILPAWDGSLFAEDCVIVSLLFSLFSLVLLSEPLSDVRVATFTSWEESLAPDRTWQQHLKVDREGCRSNANKMGNYVQTGKLLASSWLSWRVCLLKRLHFRVLWTLRLWTSTWCCVWSLPFGTACWVWVLSAPGGHWRVPARMSGGKDISISQTAAGVNRSWSMHTEQPLMENTSRSLASLPGAKPWQSSHTLKSHQQWHTLLHQGCLCIWPSKPKIPAPLWIRTHNILI